MYKKAFTLLEVLIVMAIVGIMAAATLPYTAKSYKHYIKTVETKNLISVLRRAQSMAMANTLESNYGVKISSTSAILFKGTSYATHDAQYDENYPISSTVTISAPSEIVFEKISGRPATTATITITSDNKTQKIIVGREGNIDW
ncbi:MAG: hypothetical protein RL641_373 [Candidatus Parcubacteria bacterium]|jgi:prepilin-type N-terminal cleavage/methylation domain-containing protein